MRRLALLVGLCFAMPIAVAAQNTPKFELFGGYSYTRVYNSNGDTSSTNGGTGDVGIFPVKWIGLVAAAGYSYSNGFTQTNGTQVTAETHSIHYFGGPRIRYETKYVTPFVEALFGAVHRSQLLTSTDTLLSNPQTSFAYIIGGGVDVKIVHHFSIRLIEAGYLHTSFSPISGASLSQNDFTLATGIVIH